MPYDIPLKHGVDQCSGDIIGPGGIFKALRTGPAWLDILRDAERLCPDALVLSYTNTMSILTLAVLQGTHMQTVGLCHSVQHTSRQLTDYLEGPGEELEWRCAGINRNAWFTELRHQGQDMYARLRERAQLAEVYEQGPIHFDMMLHCGAFVTESSGHFNEYPPYYRKRPKLIERDTRVGYRGESGLDAMNWPTWRERNGQRSAEMLTRTCEVPLTRIHEYAADIVEGLLLHRPQIIHADVPNRNGGLTDNCVAVACLVDRHGVQPCHFAPLPEQVAALNRAHMAVPTLLVEVLLQRDKQAARYAFLLDPLTAAVCSPAEVSSLLDEIWAAERAYLQPFEKGCWHASPQQTCRP